MKSSQPLTTVSDRKFLKKFQSKIRYISKETGLLGALFPTEEDIHKSGILAPADIGIGTAGSYRAKGHMHMEGTHVQQEKGGGEKKDFREIGVLFDGGVKVKRRNSCNVDSQPKSICRISQNKIQKDGLVLNFSKFKKDDDIQNNGRYLNTREGYQYGNDQQPDQQQFHRKDQAKKNQQKPERKKNKNESLSLPRISETYLNRKSEGISKEKENQYLQENQKEYSKEHQKQHQKRKYSYSGRIVDEGFKKEIYEKFR